MNPEQFQMALAEKGIELSDDQMKQFHHYFEMLVEWNEKMNLTAITDEKEVYLKHFYDSISAAFYVDFTKFDTICDVGLGLVFQVSQSKSASAFKSKHRRLLEKTHDFPRCASRKIRSNRCAFLP